jgi:integrase
MITTQVGPEFAPTAGAKLGDHTHNGPVPTVDQVRRLLRMDQNLDTVPTVAQWLTTWLSGRKNVKPGTLRGYASHMRIHLIPHLGQIRLDRLRVGHITGMFDDIVERTEQIRALRASDEPAQQQLAYGKRITGPGTMRSIRATLRIALNAAIRQRWIDFNPAKHVEMPPHKRPKPLVWTPDRVARWKTTGIVPSPVMVWTPELTGAFLDHIHHIDHRLYALYHLVAYRGLRRGEACGLHWEEVDLDAGTVTIRWQITQIGWSTRLDTPKTDSSQAPSHSTRPPSPRCVTTGSGNAGNASLPAKPGPTPDWYSPPPPGPRCTPPT